jgi:hypothetical protein
MSVHQSILMFRNYWMNRVIFGTEGFTLKLGKFFSGHFGYMKLELNSLIYLKCQPVSQQVKQFNPVSRSVGLSVSRSVGSVSRPVSLARQAGRSGQVSHSVKPASRLFSRTSRSVCLSFIRTGRQVIQSSRSVSHSVKPVGLSFIRDSRSVI